MIIIHHNDFFFAEHIELNINLWSNNYFKFIRYILQPGLPVLQNKVPFPIKNGVYSNSPPFPCDVLKKIVKFPPNLPFLVIYYCFQGDFPVSPKPLRRLLYILNTVFMYRFTKKYNLLSPTPTPLYD